MTQLSIDDDLYQYLINDFQKIKPARICNFLESLKETWSPETHTYPNIELILEQIEIAWKKGTLTRVLLGLLVTNVIYDNSRVIHVRRVLSIYAENNELYYFPPISFD